MAWAAWHTAAWMRSEKMPPFNTILAKKPAAPRSQNQDQLMEMVRMLNAMHGGTEEKAT